MPETLDPDAPAFVSVYVKSTGRQQDVPAHYLDDPALSELFRKTPLSPEQQRKADAVLAAANPDNPPAAGDKE